MGNADSQALFDDLPTAVTSSGPAAEPHEYVWRWEDGRADDIGPLHRGGVGEGGHGLRHAPGVRRFSLRV